MIWNLKKSAIQQDKLRRVSLERTFDKFIVILITFELFKFDRERKLW